MSEFIMLHFPRTTIAAVEMATNIWNLKLELHGPNFDAVSWKPKTVLLEGHSTFPTLGEAIQAGIDIAEKLGLDLAYNIIVDRHIEGSKFDKREMLDVTLADFFKKTGIFELRVSDSVGSSTKLLTESSE